MDIGKIKIDVLKLRLELKNNKIHPDVIILFGSQANGTARSDSDIDLAVVSRDYGHSRFEESSKLNLLASKINHSFEMVPLSLKDYLDPNAASPILNEIKKKGIVLF
jgi:predicted nucleotidyltransferase